MIVFQKAIRAHEEFKKMEEARREAVHRCKQVRSYLSRLISLPDPSQFLDKNQRQKDELKKQVERLYA